MSASKFELGQIVFTRNAFARISQEDMMIAVWRHGHGDWGELDAEDRRENERSLKEGFRLLSAYRAVNGTKFWIITEADRSVTTILLPQDY